MNEELPDPSTFTDKTLLCALKACAGSIWWTDREFSDQCQKELDRRFIERRYGPQEKPCDR